MKPFELTPEQELSIRAFEEKARGLDLDSSRAWLVELYRQKIVTETLYNQFMKDSLGLN